MIVSLFEDLDLVDDCCKIGDVEFRLFDRIPNTPPPDDHFRLMKSRAYLHLYKNAFRSVSDRRFDRVFEIGIFEGGSTAFWTEVLRPQRLVAIDIAWQGDSVCFERWVRAWRGQVTTIWGVDQADKTELLNIARSNALEPLDLVIDDGSHDYLRTKASFESLFPLLREGGLYIVEDWSWDLAPHPRPNRPLSPLVGQLATLVGSGTGAASRMWVETPFFMIERGHAHLPSSSLETWIATHHFPRASRLSRLAMSAARSQTVALLEENRLGRGALQAARRLTKPGRSEPNSKT